MILLSLFPYFVSGCDITEEEQKKRETYYNQAMENANDYIENKYDFTPEFMSTKCSNTGKFGIECSEIILVEMEYNSKDFLVYISDSKKKLDGMGNYQYEKIAKDIYYELQNAIGVVPYNYVMKFRRFGRDNVISAYYNKSNLKDMLRGWHDLCFVSYFSEHAYDETPECVHSSTSNFVLCAPNIESLVSIEYGKVEYHSLDLIKKMICIF